METRFFPVYILRWYLASVQRRRPESRMWLSLGTWRKSWNFHEMTYNMNLSTEGSIIHCPRPPDITLWKFNCESTERDSSVNSYCPVDNNTPYSRRGSMLFFLNRKVPQASREGLAVELFWAFHWCGANWVKLVLKFSVERCRGVSVEIADEWVLEPMISGRFWNRSCRPAPL